MEFLDSTKPLITYVSALIIFSFSLLRFLCGNALVFSSFEPLITIFGALIALILVLNLRGASDFWLSLAIAVIAFALLSRICTKLPAYRRWSVLAIIVFFVFGNALLFWNNDQNNIYGQEIKAMLHTRKDDEVNSELLPSRDWEQKAAGEFTEKFGAKVEIVPAEFLVEERLKEILEQLEKQKQGTQVDKDIDVFTIDVTWPGVLAEYAEDLEKFFGDVQEEFIPEIVENNTVDDKLVAVPWFLDLGLLFYRTDLLEKYHYDHPPETWNELENMAKTIQQGERREGNDDFWGFVWQGKKYEGLTCNALEWQVSHNGGTIVDVNNHVNILDLAVAAFKRANNWIWKDEISPPQDDIENYDELKTLETWKQGNAAFMRHWASSYLASKERTEFSNDFQVALLPKGNPSAGHASTLGGWQLMVNAHSKGKKKKAAIKFVEFLTSKEKQESLATKTGKLPTRRRSYGGAADLLDFMKQPGIKAFYNIGDSPNNPVSEIVPRPSTIVGKQYPEISNAYFTSVHKILKNKNSNVQEVVDALRSDVSRLLPAKR